MSIISHLKSITLAEITKLKELVDGSSAPALVTAIENAQREWKQALMELDHIDGDLAEYIIFKINAAERRYMALLEQAKKEGVTAWPATLAFTPNGIGGQNGSGDIENEPIYTG